MVTSRQSKNMMTVIKAILGYFLGFIALALFAYLGFSRGTPNETTWLGIAIAQTYSAIHKEAAVLMVTTLALVNRALRMWVAPKQASR